MEAFRELEQLVGHLADELAGFRKRALQAEARLKELDGSSSGAPPRLVERLKELERDNGELSQRLEGARDRTRQMLERMRFVRQQHVKGAEK